MIEKVIAVVQRETGREEIDARTRLDSLGMDSLEFMSLIICLRAEIGDIPDEAISYMETIDDVAKILAGRPVKA